MQNSVSIKHKIFLTAVFILGNTVIVFPKGEGCEFALYGLIPALFLTLIMCSIYLKANFRLDNYAGFANKILTCFFIIFCIVSMGITLRDYVNFVDNIRLPITSRFIISVVFILITLILGSAKRKVIYLISFYSFIMIAFIFIIMLFLSFNNMNFSNLNLSNFKLSGILNQSLTFYIHSFGQLIIILMFFNNSKANETKKILFGGAIIGYLLILICILNIFSVLGANLVNRIDYSYATVTGMVSFGRNFSRMDGLTYYIYFFASLIKSSIILNVILTTLNLNKHIILGVCGAAMLLICNINAAQNFLHSNVLNLVILIFEILFPLILIVLNSNWLKQIRHKL